jgi:FSR family fosmidomycin resistance protein-like MFS transporter
MTVGKGLTVLGAGVISYDARAALTNYSVAHALVDATTVGLVLSLGGPDAQFFTLVLLYNILAFGTQFIFGIAVDRHRAARPAAAAGCLLAGLAVPSATVDHTLAVVLAGLGNSLFHVGGGSMSLSITPGRATAPGIFVAPGALGLFAGVMLARSDAYRGEVFVFLMLLSAAIS